MEGDSLLVTLSIVGVISPGSDDSDFIVAISIKNDTIKICLRDKGCMEVYIIL